VFVHNIAVSIKDNEFPFTHDPRLSIRREKIEYDMENTAYRTTGTGIRFYVSTTGTGTGTLAVVIVQQKVRKSQISTGNRDYYSVPVTGTSSSKPQTKD
jgi:hypothetical protein